jgi:DNA polymerase (family 10)
VNQQIATILRELAILYEIQGVPFKPRALERAADGIAGHGTDVRDVFEDGGRAALEQIPGVGAGVAERIEEYLRRGRIAEHERMKKKLPVDVIGLTAIEGIGPKTLALLYKKLRVRTRAQLLRAARNGKVASLRGIGERGQERILQALRYQRADEKRFLPGHEWPHLLTLTEAVQSWPHVRQVELCGSLRRMQESVGDVDLLVQTTDAEDTLRRFVALPVVRSVYSHGTHRALVRLHRGMDADLTTMDAESWGAALIAWTGNKAHNIRLRTLAKKKGYLLDDYGLFKGTRRVAGRTEREVYAKLGMQYIEPELRSDTGEIDAALRGELPRLVGYTDVKGDLQVQTDWTDGEHSILQMARAAQAAGLDYIAITDHTKYLTVAGGLDARALRRQWAEIDRVQRLVPGIKILKGTECDIHKDGTLDLPDAVLAKLDVVGVSVHSSFGLSEAEQTARVVRALEHPYSHILFHPTGRLIGRRPPIALHMPTIIAAAKRTRTVLEVNAYPDRLDLRDEHVRMAVDAGVQLAINTDAHSVEHYRYLRWGIGTARRGWATTSDVINTRSWQDMLKLVQKKRTAR